MRGDRSRVSCQKIQTGPTREIFKRIKGREGSSEYVGLSSRNALCMKCDSPTGERAQEEGESS